MKTMNKLDKRTKKYKQSKGLGDTIEKITTATGIKAVVDSLFDDCGCDKRKEILNKMFPYKVNCLNENEYNQLKEWFKFNRLQVNAEQQRMLLTIYNRVFNKGLKFSTCGSCVRNMVRDLEKVYYEYK
jgi:hypothetical protein